MKNFILLIFLVLSVELYSQNIKAFPKIALTNRVTFHDSQFNNSLAGCAFLIDVGFDTLAITCKHALWVAKSDKMESVDFEGTLKEWRMQRKDDTTQFVIMDRLINVDSTENIGQHNVEKDWLIFTIKENKSDVVPLRIFMGELTKGDTLHHIGWSFKDKTGSQRIHTSIYQKSIPNHILANWISKPANDHGGGLSGSPYITKDQRLVAITSGYSQDPETEKWFPSPCSTEYLLEQLYDYWLEKNNYKNTDRSMEYFKEYIIK